MKTVCVCWSWPRQQRSRSRSRVLVLVSDSLVLITSLPCIASRGRKLQFTDVLTATCRKRRIDISRNREQWYRLSYTLTLARWRQSYIHNIGLLQLVMLLLQTTAHSVQFQSQWHHCHRPINTQYTVYSQHCSSCYSQISGRSLYSADWTLLTTTIDCNSTAVQSRYNYSRRPTSRPGSCAATEVNKQVSVRATCGSAARVTSLCT